MCGVDGDYFCVWKTLPCHSAPICKVLSSRQPYRDGIHPGTPARCFGIPGYRPLACARCGVFQTLYLFHALADALTSFINLADAWGNFFLSPWFFPKQPPKWHQHSPKSGMEYPKKGIRNVIFAPRKRVRNPFLGTCKTKKITSWRCSDFSKNSIENVWGMMQKHPRHHHPNHTLCMKIHHPKHRPRNENGIFRCNAKCWYSILCTKLHKRILSVKKVKKWKVKKTQIPSRPRVYI